MASTEAEATASKIKSGRARRSRYTNQERVEIVAAFEASALSASAFARQQEIKYSTFCSWVAKAKARRQARSRQTAPSSNAFIIAEIGQESAVGCEVLEVRLPGGAATTAASSKQVALLAELLKSLV